MSLNENILNLRKKNGLSQEKLAEQIDVTRQTISNWELGETSPNPEQLKLLSKTLNVSIDELVDNTNFMNSKEKVNYSYNYEYVSKTKINGIPLVHINLGLGNGVRKAKGIIAIGNVARGIIAIGGIAMGLLSLGAISIGLISIGGLVALGLLLSIAGISIGSIAIGGIAIGLFTIGGLSIGIYSIGGMAIAKNVACGDHSYGYIAIGNYVNGTIELIKNEVSSVEIKNIILEHFPNTWNIIASILSNIKV